jgi:hypothetical protein
VALAEAAVLSARKELSEQSSVSDGSLAERLLVSGSWSASDVRTVLELASAAYQFDGSPLLRLWKTSSEWLAVDGHVGACVYAPGAWAYEEVARIVQCNLRVIGARAEAEPAVASLGFRGTASLENWLSVNARARPVRLRPELGGADGVLVHQGFQAA